jgi:hypothetical protein
MESQEAGFHPSHAFWKSLWDYHIPTTSTAGVFEEQQQKKKKSQGEIEVLTPQREL